MVRGPNRCETRKVGTGDSAALRTCSGREDIGGCECTDESLCEGQWASHHRHQRETKKRAHSREEQKHEEERHLVEERVTQEEYQKMAREMT